MSLLPSFLAGRFAGHLPARQPAPRVKPRAPRVVTGPIRRKTLRRLVARGIDPSRLRATSMVAVARRGPKPSPMPAPRTPASPMPRDRRTWNYRRQNGDAIAAKLTARQRRRSTHKLYAQDRRNRIGAGRS